MKISSDEQFKNLLSAVVEAYQELGSIRMVESELNISMVKVRKLLITANAYDSDIASTVNKLYSSDPNIIKIMKITHLGRASVYSYLPYKTGAYKMEVLSLDAESCARYRERKSAVKTLQETLNNSGSLGDGNRKVSYKALWNCLVAFQRYPFRTISGLRFTYTIKIGKSGEFTRELVIDRREESKSLTWSSIVLAYNNAMGKKDVVDQPKALGDIRGVSYIYPIFWRFGLIRVPEKAAAKMERPQGRRKWTDE